MKKNIITQGLIGLFTILMFGMTLSLAQPARADGRTDAALQLLLTMKLARTLDNAIEQMMENQIKEHPAMAPYREVVRRFIAKYMGWEILKNDFVRIYSEEFTEKELRDMIAFYSTPTGAKAIEKIPILIAKGTALGIQHFQQNMAELAKLIQAEKDREKNKQK